MFTDNKRMVPKVKLVTQIQPRDTNDKAILFPLSILVLKHFLMTGTFIIADRLEISSFSPKKDSHLGGGDMKQANSNHHQQEILLQIVTNTVENEFERCFHQIIITLVAEVCWAANANAGINKYS